MSDREVFTSEDSQELEMGNTIIRPEDKCIAVLGFWYGLNYGAVMTAFALVRHLESEGYIPTLVDITGFPDVPATDRDESSVFRKFYRNKAVSITPVLNGPEQIYALNDSYNTFLIASDQLWRYEYTANLGHVFFLDFVAQGKRRVAYGTSIGTDRCKAPQEFRELASGLLSLFQGVSSRETNGVDILKCQYGIDAQFVLDPVFLADMDIWERCAADSKEQLPEGDYIFSYILDRNNDAEKVLSHVATKENAKIMEVPDARAEAERTGDVTALLPPDAWIAGIKNCKCVVTDSYHGMCFAIIFNKPFIVIANRTRGYSRFVSVLDSLNLKQHLIEKYEDIHQMDLPPIDWDKINNRLEAMRNESKAWLLQALRKPITDSNRCFETLFVERYKLLSKIRDIRDISVSQNSMIMQLQDNLAMLREDVESLRNDIALIIQEPHLTFKYYRYKILSKISFGPKRAKYKKKKIFFRNLLRQSKMTRRKYMQI